MYAVPIVMTMVFGSDAWLFTTDIRKSLNGVSSKMLSTITKHTIHAEAKNPSFDVVDHVKCRRKSYLGHLLRLDENRTVRHFLLELSPPERPFIEGSLLEEVNFENVQMIIDSAKNREF